MFVVVFIFFIILFIILNKIDYLDLISKRIILIYLITWGSTILVSILNINHLTPVSTKTYIIMILHVLGFILGFISIKISKQHKNEQIIYLNSSQNYLTRNKIFRILVCGSTLYVISLLLVFYQKLSMMSLSEIRYDYFFDNKNLYGPMFNILNFILLVPLNMVYIPVFSWMLFYKRNWLCLIIAIFLFGYASLSGGRFNYVRIVAGIALTVICFFTPQMIKKRLLHFLMIIIVAFILLAATTAGRFSMDINAKNRDVIVEQTIDHMISYATGPIAAFDYMLHKHNFASIGDFQYGKLTTYSIKHIFDAFANKFDIQHDNTFPQFAEIKQERTISIGPDQATWNALYTSVLYYYLDFGWFGVFFFPFIFGYLLRYVIKQMYKYKTLAMFLVISIMFDVMMLSICDLFFVTFNKIILLIILYYTGKYKIKWRTLSRKHPIFSSYEQSM